MSLYVCFHCVCMYFRHEKCTCFTGFGHCRMCLYLHVCVRKIVYMYERIKHECYIHNCAHVCMTALPAQVGSHAHIHAYVPCMPSLKNQLEHGIYVYIHTYIYTHIYIHIYIHTHTYKHIYTYIYI